MDQITQWIVQHTPHELAPYFGAWAAHWDTARPALIVFLGAYVLFWGLLVGGIVRAWLSRGSPDL
jgi:hypothetical protein